MLAKGNYSFSYEDIATDHLFESTFLSNFALTVANTSNGSMLTNMSDEATLTVKEWRIVVGVILSMFSLVTIVGNLLVIVAVVKEVYLRTVTNYMIVSLATADLMVGSIVMPFSISHEVSNQVWFYGVEWCDLWHSFDVLASTASILNLCIISLDRYWAITNPIEYPSRMSTCKVSILITFAWLCSAGISFPAIAWWKAVTPSDMPDKRCMFTEDSVYLIISSLISFYCPTIVMIFVYAKIYRAATEQTKSIKTGTKIMTSSRLFGPGGVMTLRIHRGRPKRVETPSDTRVLPHDSDSDADNVMHSSSADCHSLSPNQSPNHEAHGDHKTVKYITKRLRHLAITKRLTKFAREKKAAKTLGIVVGVFIICWLPFFITNTLFGICKANCVILTDILFPVFTWLGYINSGVNPIIYALSMRDFRRAFGKIIFVCCPKYLYSRNRRRQNSRDQINTASSYVTTGVL
ncbi:hypothetical protein ACJMK2_005282 [Sinanodonta woodiana]|uniref:G-protein coupled receptors family 1 profile domain-containing protein n=1 Tax=Sinanodonta woodiana TaxID=1069815 RepID=A0ABD3VT15_SINWO